MKEAVAALQTFLEGFGVPAYDENSVPGNAVLPYLTYTPVITDWRSSALLMVRLWDYPGPDQSADRLYGIVDKISEAVGEGIRIPAGEGYITLYKGTPWAQPQPTPEIRARVIILNFEITTYV